MEDRIIPVLLNLKIVHVSGYVVDTHFNFYISGYKMCSNMDARTRFQLSDTGLWEIIWDSAVIKVVCAKDEGEGGNTDGDELVPSSHSSSSSPSSSVSVVGGYSITFSQSVLPYLVVSSFLCVVLH